jgi:biopolymer transport protein ExbD
VADGARVPLVVTARFVVNVYADGSMGDEHGRTLSAPELTRRLASERTRTPTVRLHVRSDRHVAHAAVQRVLSAARDAGVTDVIFGAYTSDL